MPLAGTRDHIEVHIGRALADELVRRLGPGYAVGHYPGPPWEDHHYIVKVEPHRGAPEHARRTVTAIVGVDLTITISRGSDAGRTYTLAEPRVDAVSLIVRAVGLSGPPHQAEGAIRE